MLATRTFLFADLREYTTFVERHGDAAAATLIADYRRVVRTELARHEGGEIKTEGDSFYVVFTNTGSAVTCAAAILRAAEAYSRDRPDRPMRIGVGIHAGEPVPHEGQFVGTAVIVAARLAQNAKAGELLVTEVVRALLPRSQTMPMSERTGLTLKGLDDPPKVFSVEWATAPSLRRSAVSEDVAISAAAPAGQQVLCPVVIGRDRETAALDGHLAEAIAGHGRTVLVSGEAGLGKSALMRRFQERVREQGARLLIGECTEIEARRPFGPFIDALTSGDLALPSELEQGGPGALPVAEVERYRVHSAFAERLAEAARERPLVVVIEDLHWGDEATFELVPYLARKLKDEPVLLIATYRSDELHRLHPLNHVLAELSRGRIAEDIRLRRLTLEEVGQVIGRSLGLKQAPTAAFRQAIFDRTEGNPFFVEEILRALVERGELAYRDGAWHRDKEVADLTIPASVRDAVQQRLLGLEPRARKAMQVAAVIGQRFDFELLGAVSGLDEAGLLDVIKAAIDAQLVREETDTEGNESFAFRHALSREAVLTELLQRERRLLHRSVGEAIERLVGTSVGTRAEELAYHFDEARDIPRAFRYHGIAAERSRTMAAPRAAMRHLERAIELAPDDEPALVDLLLRLGDVALSMADTPIALRAATQARAIAEERGDRLAAGEAIHRIATCHWYLGQTAQAIEVAREGVALLEPLGASAPLAACNAELARLAMIDHRDDEAVELGERAAEMAREVGAGETEVRALITVATAISSHGDDAGVDMLRQAFQLATERGFPMEAERALNNLVPVISATDGSLTEMLNVHRQSLAYAKRFGHRSDALLGREVMLGYFSGGWDQALAVDAEARADGIWSAGREQFAAIMLVAREGPTPAHLDLGAAARRRLLAAGDHQWNRMASLSTGIYYIAERWAEAIAIADRLVATPDRGGAFNLVLQAALIAWRSAALTGDPDARERWTGELGRLRGRRTAEIGSLMLQAAAARERNGHDAAVDPLREGLALLDDRPSPFASVVFQQELVEVLVGAGRNDEAAEVFTELTAFWRKAKATWYLGRLEGWARELGLAVQPA